MPLTMQQLGSLAMILALLFCRCKSASTHVTTNVPYRIAYGSCLNQDKPQPFWTAMLADSPRAFLFLGDTIYADTEDMSVKKAAYAQLNAQPGFRSMKALGPIWAMWDDHDYGRNDMGTAYPMKAESQRVFLDAFDEPANSARRKQKGIYFAKTLAFENLRVQFIFPDLRYSRTEWTKGPATELYTGTHAIDSSPQATMLGESQWSWLEQIAREEADLRIFVSSSAVLTDDFPGERWGAFPRERARLIKLMQSTRGSWLILSGDRHFAQVLRRSDMVTYPLYELVSSGLNNGWADGVRDKDRHRLNQIMAEDNYGLLDIDTQRKQLFYQMKSAAGVAKLTGIIPFAEIKLSASGNKGS